MGVLFPAFSFQVDNQSSSDAQSVLFRFPLPHLWIFNFAFMMICSWLYDDLLLILGWLTPAFRMIYPYFYDEVVQYRLNPHGHSLDFVSAVDCNTSLPRIQNFQAEKIIVSSRENFMFNTRMHFIPYKNEVHSSKEWSVFS